MITPELFDELVAAVDDAGPRIARLAAKHGSRYRAEIEHEIRQRLLCDVSRDMSQTPGLGPPARYVHGALAQVAEWAAVDTVRRFEGRARCGEDDRRRRRRVPLELQALERAPGVPLELEERSPDRGPHDVDSDDFWLALKRHLPAQLWYLVHERFARGRTLRAIGADIGLSESRTSQLLACSMRALEAAGDAILELLGAEYAAVDLRRYQHFKQSPERSMHPGRVCVRRKLPRRRPATIDRVEEIVRRCRPWISRALLSWPREYRGEIFHETEQALRIKGLRHAHERDSLERLLFGIVDRTTRQEGWCVMQRLRGTQRSQREGVTREPRAAPSSFAEETISRTDFGVSDRSIWRRVDAEDAIDVFWRRAWEAFLAAEAAASRKGQGRRKNRRAVAWYWSLYGPLSARMSWDDVGAHLGLSPNAMSVVRRQAIGILERAGLNEILE